VCFSYRSPFAVYVYPLSNISKRNFNAIVTLRGINPSQVNEENNLLKWHLEHNMYQQMYKIIILIRLIILWLAILYA
jgi:hypothetical protein